MKLDGKSIRGLLTYFSLPDSGKSTQVPTFLLEDQLSRGKHCRIYCTEPRRISAISLAQRRISQSLYQIVVSSKTAAGVSQELGEVPNSVGTSNSLVGYSIRLESNTSKTTRLTFVTNGIALRMLESGTAPGGQGTAFDDITVSSCETFPPPWGWAFPSTLSLMRSATFQC